MHLARRIFLTELDSVAMRRLHDDSTDPSRAMARVVGALRVAHLIGGEILVTDSMLLDSRFFTTVGPRDLATLLGSPPGDLPLTVLVNGPTVGDALDVAEGHAVHPHRAAPSR